MPPIEQAGQGPLQSGSSDNAAAKKRKSTGSSTAPAKKPRTTLDNFFSPTLKVHSATAKEYSHVTLNDEQNRVLKMAVDDGQSVFFTGSAGTGKSLLLRAIIAALKRKYRTESDVVSVTASTGMAASNIGGTITYFVCCANQC